MGTVNENLRDESIRHAVDLHQYSTGVVQRIIALLNRVDPDLVAQIAAALERMTPATFSAQRLDDLLQSVRALNAQAYGQIERELTAELRDLTAYEIGYQGGLFATTIPPQVIARVGIGAVDVGQTYAAAMARPFQGVVLKEALKGLEEGRARAIRDEIRMGYVENQTTAQIIQRVRGTRAAGYADGIMEAPRRHIEAVVRTAISHTAGFAREKVMKANSDLIKAVVWTSTLDSRTSKICVLRDGKQYTNDDAHKPIGHKLPWLGGPGAAHYNCRSCAIPVTASWRSLGINIDEMPAGTRASMDGQVPAETTFSQWLMKQPAGRQDQVLGPVRGKLLRDGGLTIDRFATDKGRWLSLDELRQRDAEAFKRAGIQ